VKPPRKLKSGGSKSAYLFFFFYQIAKRKLKKRQSGQIKIMTRRSVVMDEGVQLQYNGRLIFLKHFQSKLKMQNVFMIMNCKNKTYFIAGKT